MKKMLVVILLILALYTLSIVLMRKITAVSCGGFTGETGEFACPDLFNCHYSNSFPDASGSCRFVGDILP